MDYVRNPEKLKDKAVRTKPSQARGKARVSLILTAALELFRENGMENVTTNDIAEKAQIPIGSLYRYYPNKDSIMDAVIDVYMDDFASIFKGIAANPELKHMSWDEIISIMFDAVISYSKRNGSFMFLFGVWANPILYEHSRSSRIKCVSAFASVLKKRYPKLKKRQALLCFNLSIVTMKMAMSEEDQRVGGNEMLRESAQVIAAYLERISGTPDRDAADLLFN